MTAVDPERVRRPDRRLLWSSLLSSFAWGPLFPIAMVRAVLRWRTLEYRFDDDGVHASWGVLFRKEITLAYNRIQDLHLTSNVVERWLDLARIEIQTASGASGSEMTIEGLRDFEDVRDDLARRMKDTRTSPAPAPLATDPLLQVAQQLQLVAQELRMLTTLIEGRRSPPPARPVPIEGTE